MRITRTPFRVTLGGGGTDLPSYYKSRKEFIFAAASNRRPGVHPITGPAI